MRAYRPGERNIQKAKRVPVEGERLYINSKLVRQSDLPECCSSSVLNWTVLPYPCRASSVLVFVVKMYPEQDRGR
jgi:hypothetical protein